MINIITPLIASSFVIFYLIMFGKDKLKKLKKGFDY